jgi:hypothetical protein
LRTTVPQRHRAEADIRKWINEWKKNPKPFAWVKPADEIPGTLAADCRPINDSAHQNERGAEGARVMDTPVRNYPPDDQRVSDADRDHAVSGLSEAFQAGRITPDEFEQRSGRALSARTGKELTDLFTDLQKDNVPAARTAAGRLARSPRAVGTWIATGASGAAAISLAFLTLVNALTAGTNPGLTLP